MLLQLLVIISITVAEHLTGVFTDASIVYDTANNYPSIAPTNAWFVSTFDWSIDGATVSPGDTFGLTIPCLFRLSFPETSIDLVAGGLTVATCSLYVGALFTPFGSISCTASPNIQTSGLYSGSISLPMIFSTGGVLTESEFTCASEFSTGINNVIPQVTFYDGTIPLVAPAPFEIGQTDYDSNEIYYGMRIVPSMNKDRNYLLAGNCPNGYDSGTIGFATTSKIDCSTVVQGYGTSFNTWLYPLSHIETNFQVQCSDYLVTYTYTDIPAGGRPYISMLAFAPPVQGVTLDYTNRFKCKGAPVVNGDKTVNWNRSPNSDADSGGAVDVVMVTQTWTGTTTDVFTSPYTTGGTKTVVVQIPPPETTTTETWTGTTPYTSTLPFTPGDPTRSVIVYTPPPEAITTETWTGTTPYTTTLPFAPGDSTRSVIVYTPPPEATITEPWTGTTPYTSTLPFAPGDPTRSVIVYTPPLEATITQTWTGTTPYTSTLPFAPGDSTRSVIVYTPPPEATITEPWTGTTPYTSTLPFAPGDSTRSVIVYTPVGETPVPETTVISTWTGKTPATTTLPYTSGGTKTVVIFTPSATIPQVTNIVTWTGTTVYTTTLPLSDGGGTETVVVYTPYPEESITKTWTGATPYTTTLPFTTGGTRTVEVFVPSSKIYWNTTLNEVGPTKPIQPTKPTQPPTQTTHLTVTNYQTFYPPNENGSGGNGGNEPNGGNGGGGNVGNEPNGGNGGNEPNGGSGNGSNGGGDNGSNGGSNPNNGGSPGENTVDSEGSATNPTNSGDIPSESSSPVITTFGGSGGIVTNSMTLLISILMMNLLV